MQYDHDVDSLGAKFLFTFYSNLDSFSIKFTFIS